MFAVEERGVNAPPAAYLLFCVTNCGYTIAKSYPGAVKFVCREHVPNAAPTRAKFYLIT